MFFKDVFILTKILYYDQRGDLGEILGTRGVLQGDPDC